MSESGWLRLLAKAGLCAPSGTAAAEAAAAPTPPAPPTCPADSLLLEAAHDLRQPMQALSLYIASLEAHNLPPEVQIIACGLAGSAGQLERQLNNLIDLAKLRQGLLQHSPQNIAIGPVIQDLVSDRLVCAHAGDVHLRAVASTHVVDVGPQQLERLLGLLLDLAMRDAKDGVVIGCRRRKGACVVQAHAGGPSAHEADTAWSLLAELAQFVGGRAQLYERPATSVWELSLPLGASGSVK